MFQLQSLILSLNSDLNQFLLILDIVAMFPSTYFHANCHIMTPFNSFPASVFIKKKVASHRQHF